MRVLLSPPKVSFSSAEGQGSASRAATKLKSPKLKSRSPHNLYSITTPGPATTTRHRPNILHSHELFHCPARYTGPLFRSAGSHRLDDCAASDNPSSLNHRPPDGHLQHSPREASGIFCVRRGQTIAITRGRKSLRARSRFSELLKHRGQQVSTRMALSA